MDSALLDGSSSELFQQKLVNVEPLGVVGRGVRRSDFDE